MTAASRLQILVFGYMIRMPLGGLVWHYLQYALGLAALGHDVYYLEDSCFFEEDQKHWFHNPETGQMGDDPAPGMRFTADLLRGTTLEHRWALYDAANAHWIGPLGERVLKLCSSADLLLNISAANPVRDPFLQVPRRVFLDTDPAFSQVRILTCPYRRALALRHNCFLTFGENIGTARCLSPTAGFDWKPTRQPVLLDHWPVTPGPASGNFTTVLAWDSFRYEEYLGVRYGMKSQSFQNFIDLPGRTKARFELSFFDRATVPDELRRAQWQIRAGQTMARHPRDYQAYVRGSKAEFSVAKHGYTISRCGWFSDRSATYLASGRPVVLQDTGFPDILPAGRGLLAFRTVEDAQAAVDEVESRYDEHCTAARDLAAEYFDSRQVLPDMIDKIQQLAAARERAALDASAADERIHG